MLSFTQNCLLFCFLIFVSVVNSRNLENLTQRGKDAKSQRLERRDVDNSTI